MVAFIGVIASPSQCAGYFERDGYYTKDHLAHRQASAWAGKGAGAFEFSPVDSGTFKAVLEGQMPHGPRLGKRGTDGEIAHCPGRNVALSVPKPVSLDGDYGQRRAHLPVPAV